MSSPSEHSRTNVHLLEQLESTYNALSSAVYDPVVIVNPAVARGTILPIDGVPLDSSQDFFYERKAEGERVLRERATTSRDSILESYQFHESMARKFHQLEEVLTAGNKMNVVIHVGTLCTLMELYGGVVAAHWQEVQEKCFLQFPNYLSGKVGFRRGGVILNIPSFNPSGSEIGYTHEIAILRDTIDHFDQAGDLTLGGVHTGKNQSYFEALKMVRTLFQDYIGFDVEQK